MRSNHLAYTWKGVTTYVYTYILVTDKFSIEDIGAAQANGKKIVLWGWRPESFAVVCALKHAGISVDIACDVQQYEADFDFMGISVVNYKEILKDVSPYFFIVALRDYAEHVSVIKLLLYQGVDEFGIVYDSFSKDFNGNNLMQKAFFDSINEVFSPINFLGNWNEIANIRRASLEGAGYWDFLYMWIYRFFKKKSGIKYLEVGAGIGIMSLSLKKLMDIDVTWITIPNEEQLWAEWRRESSANLLKKYDIKTINGFIELDSFRGQYDIIVCAQVMEHFIYNPVNSMKKLRNLLTDNGYLFVSVPQEIVHHNVDSYREMPYPDDLSEEQRNRRMVINNFGHFHEYSYDEAISVFTDSGFDCIGYKWASPIHHFMLRKSVGNVSDNSIAPRISQ